MGQADEELQRPQPPAEELDWAPVLAWRARVAALPDAWWRPAPGAASMFDAGYPDEIGELITILHAAEVVAPFPWPAWMEQRGQALWDAPELVSEASLEDCRRLLAAVVRGERFTTGAVGGGFDDGVIPAALDRIAALVGPTAPDG